MSGFRGRQLPEDLRVRGTRRHPTGQVWSVTDLRPKVPAPDVVPPVADDATGDSTPRSHREETST